MFFCQNSLLAEQLLLLEVLVFDMEGSKVRYKLIYMQAGYGFFLRFGHHGFTRQTDSERICNLFLLNVKN